MDVTFASQKLAKICNSAQKVRAKFGDRMAAVLMRRLLDLSAAENLGVMKLLPGRCHELTADRKGQLALDLVQPYRLIFVPDHHPRPQLAEGGRDWGSVTQVMVIEIIDDHD